MHTDEVANSSRNDGNTFTLPAVGSVVRLKPEVEQEKTMHRGKYFNVAGIAGRFLILTWGEQKVFFLPDEVDVVTQ